ncbi:MAG: Chromosomal replication initiator protein DnaA [Parcubacteria group bacterium GW2011_GWC2_39_14]|nr:MAG: Chromosomal replication initiator protein DnaA [Parcubacteria group bacterium GW2011_GWC2_39_14]
MKPLFQKWLEPVYKNLAAATWPRSMRETVDLIALYTGENDIRVRAFRIFDILVKDEVITVKQYLERVVLNVEPKILVRWEKFLKEEKEENKDLVKEIEKQTTQTKIPKNTSVQSVLAVIAKVVGLKSVKELFGSGRCRSKRSSIGRHIASYLLKNDLEMSYVQIVRILGIKNHTSVMYGAKKVSALIAKNNSNKSAKMRLQIALIRQELSSEQPKKGMINNVT